MIGLYLQIIITTLLPAFLLYSMYVQKYPTQLVKGAYLGLNAMIFFALFMIARWDALFYGLRYVWPILFVLFAIMIIRRPLDTSEKKKTNKYTTYAIIAIAVGVAGANSYLVAKSITPNDSVNVAAVLKDDKYYVGHGGDATYINYHNYHSTQRYAIDVVSYETVNNPFSDKKDLNSYSIFGATIYSPCAGTIKEARKDFNDLTPPESDRDNPGGNGVVISCNNIEIHISHMMKGSVLVSEGDTVTEGQKLGKVGNSGNTSEPHLHIHAVRPTADNPKGTPVPLVIDGKFLVRNDIIN